MNSRTTIIVITLLAATMLAACAIQTPIASLPTSMPSPTPSTPQPTPAQSQIVAPTPVCGTLEATPAMTEGPYYKSNPPERTSLLEPGHSGVRLVITGYVITLDCKPIARARVDFWQADDKGAYDNAGYKWRGYQLTDEAGRYAMETVIPGLYPGRTRHIHVKVQAPNRPELTTQLYFPNEAGNATDSIFNPKLVLAIQDGGDFKIGTFTFVLR